MFLVDLEFIISKLRATLSKQRVEDAHSQDWLYVRLFIWFELFLTIQVDAQRAHFAKRSLCVPVSALELLAVLSHNDHFTSKSEISVEPRSPQTTSVSHYVEHVVAKLIQL